MIWQVKINGNINALEFLARIIPTGPRRIIEDQRDPGYLYESDSFHHRFNHRSIEDIAKREVAVLSGIVRLERYSSDGLTCGRAHRVDEIGRRSYFLSVEPAQLVLTGGEVNLYVGNRFENIRNKPAPPPSRSALRSALLIQLAIADPAIAKVMRLMDAPDAATWVGQYRLHEVIEEDIGGQRKLEKQNWGLPDEMRRFKHSANSVQIAGDSARHGKEPHISPSNPMTTEEAANYVRRILQAWLDVKSRLLINAFDE